MPYPALGPFTSTLLSDPDVLLGFLSQLTALSPSALETLAFCEGSQSYRCATIPKKAGGKRKISIPTDALAIVQIALAKAFVRTLPIHPAAHGYASSRSIFTFVALHAASRYLLQLDIHDFFKHVTPAHVVQTLAAGGADSESLQLLVGWCFERGVAPAYAPSRQRLWLPQGATTSPALSNVGAFALDEKLSTLAEAKGGIYTRYVDDLALSLPFHLGRTAGRRLLAEIIGVLGSCGFAPRRDKVYGGPLAPTESWWQQLHRPPLVGLILGSNGNVSAARSLRRRLRAALHHQETGRYEPYTWDATQVEGVQRFLDRIARAFPKNP